MVIMPFRTLMAMMIRALMATRLTRSQRMLSRVPVTSVHCRHCGKQVSATYTDLLWRKVSLRFWYDIETARAWYCEELRLIGLLREYEDNDDYYR
jgi:hypothetical protein